MHEARLSLTAACNFRTQMPRQMKFMIALLPPKHSHLDFLSSREQITSWIENSNFSHRCWIQHIRCYLTWIRWPFIVTIEMWKIGSLHNFILLTASSFVSYNTTSNTVLLAEAPIADLDASFVTMSIANSVMASALLAPLVTILSGIILSSIQRSFEWISFVAKTPQKWVMVAKNLMIFNKENSWRSQCTTFEFHTGGLSDRWSLS